MAVDPRRSFRRSLRGGGAIIDLAFRAPALRHPPIVALCDISGSMSEYTRVFLHFLHALGEKRRVTTFLFGTRLTNVTRALTRARRRRSASRSARARSRIGPAARASAPRSIGSTANGRAGCWGRGRSCILFTDGLERDGAESLAREMERLRKSCRRLIWVNPLAAL